MVEFCYAGKSVLTMRTDKSSPAPPSFVSINKARASEKCGLQQGRRKYMRTLRFRIPYLNKQSLCLTAIGRPREFTGGEGPTNNEYRGCALKGSRFCLIVDVVLVVIYGDAEPLCARNCRRWRMSSYPMRSVLPRFRPPVAQTTPPEYNLMTTFALA